MKKSTFLLLIALLIVVAVGIGSSVELTYIHYKINYTDDDFKSFCNINETMNCDAVSVTPWSKLLGVPISILGAFTYLFVFALALIRLTKLREKIPNSSVYIWWIGFFSVCYSIYLAWICYAEIGTWCLMCIVLYTVNALMFVLAWLLLEKPILSHLDCFLEDAKIVFGDIKKTAALIVLLGGVIAMFSTGMYVEKQQKLAKLAEVSQKLVKLDKPVSLEGDVIGNPNGKVVIVLFSDYQCPFCSKMDLMLEEMTGKFSELKIIRRDFPLDQQCNPIVKRAYHPYACVASMFKNCAKEQDKFFEMHMLLLNNRQSISPEFLQANLKQLGLDETKINECLNSNRPKDKLDKDINAAIEIKITGTPTLIFDGKEMVKGGLSHDELERLISIKSDL